MLHSPGSTECGEDCPVHHWRLTLFTAAPKRLSLTHPPLHKHLARTYARTHTPHTHAHTRTLAQTHVPLPLLFI